MFKVGDKVKIIQDGCNNSSCKEFKRSQLPSDKVFTIERVETKGIYYANGLGTYTIFLEGNPIWASYCELIENKQEIINNYQIY